MNLSTIAILLIAWQLLSKKNTPPSSPFENLSQFMSDEEGFKFETPSKASQDFFKPIDNIADAEIKHKLYWFYDNWYIKN